MIRHSIFNFPVFAALLISGPIALLGQATSLPPKQADQVFEIWEVEIKKIDELLQKHPKAAYKRSSKLLDEMRDRLINGPATGHFLGSALSRKALAAYGLGEEAEAVWQWQVALQLFPELEKSTLAAYGEAGAFLKHHPVRKSSEREGYLDEMLSEEDLVNLGLTLEPFDFPSEPNDVNLILPPKKLKAPSPVFPRARLGTQALVEIEAIVGLDGAVREPVVIRAEGELTVVYAALDAMRKWTFRPATSNGRPIESLYTLTVHFDS